MERRAEMADGSVNIQDETPVSRLVACVRFCVCLRVSRRKEAETAGAVCPSNQITERKRERESEGDKERERESPLRNRCNSEHQKNSLKCS